MSAAEARESKRRLRERMRALPRPPPAADLVPREALARWLSLRPGLRTLAAFAALPGEVDLLPLLASLPDRRWLLPRVTGEELVFHAVADPARDLVPGAYGILEPQPGLAEVGIAEIDLFLCPGLAFDPRGGRLGRGRGYYDRALARARADALKLGVCHPARIVADTFPEPHDMPMDAVISA